ncbi:MAG TPA: hypothetical protein PKD98_09060, partial [Anaerolineae bacterium]|nr:hypothetical protein [Anaerolineae bacterium]
MVEIKMQINDGLAQRLQPMYDWLPTVLELSLVGFKTPAVQTASEIIDFLATGPSPTEVMTYHVSDRAQERLRRLLAISEAGLASPEEQAELDEVAQSRHLLIFLKVKTQGKQT